jgi:hypothetical protein
MPISDATGYETGHFGRVYEHLLKPAIVEAGFKPLRADDTVKTDYIVVGIVRCVVDSAMVLCDFSARNPNVMYELGIRHAFNRPVVLVRDTRTDRVFDIQGLRYTEYDSSLRIDGVQKDIKKITEAIKETAKADDAGFNSVVHLAGIHSATVPEKQEISGDTQLLLSAIAALEGRIDLLDGRARQSASRYFKVEEHGVTFGDGSLAKLGDDIYDPSLTGQDADVGKIVDLHPAEQKIFLQRPNGKTTPFSGYSIKSKNLSALPF